MAKQNSVNTFMKPVFDMTSGKYVPQNIMTLSAKSKKDWVDKLYGHKVSKKQKIYTKVAVYGIGALALLGAGNTIARRFGK
jgi:hypothetical protein